MTARHAAIFDRMRAAKEQKPSPPDRIEVAWCPVCGTLYGFWEVIGERLCGCDSRAPKLVRVRYQLAKAPDGEKTREGTAQAYIDDGLIKIGVRISWIPQTIRDSIAAGYIEGGVRVTKALAPLFAKDVVNALNEEKEDGTTKVHELFDDAFERAIENGSQGCILNKNYPLPRGSR